MKKQINIPNKQKDFKLWQYQELLKIADPTAADVVRLLLDVDKATVDSIALNDVNELASTMMEGINAKPKFKPTFTLNGQEFGFIPKLDAITWGENGDLVKYINETETAHRAMAVMFRPITTKRKEKYLIEDYGGTEAYAELMRNAPLSAYLGARVFFYNLMNELLLSTLSYMEKEEAKLTTSPKNGEAIRKHINSLRGILEPLTQSTNNHYTNAYSYSPLKAT